VVSPAAEARALEVATLGGGCFWCVEAIFLELRGVASVVSGYAGGGVPNPTYRQVCSGATGAAEVVQITYDAGQISYREVLEVFFHTHDPTTMNRQGDDVGTQYRSAIFYHNEGQRRIAEQVKSEIAAAGVWKDPIITEIVPHTSFYAAEDYHQKYFETNPNAAYCRFVVSPKVQKFRKQFRDRLKNH